MGKKLTWPEEVMGMPPPPAAPSLEAAAATPAAMALLASLSIFAIRSSLPFWPYGNPEGPKVGGFGRSSAIYENYTPCQKMHRHVLSFLFQ